MDALLFKSNLRESQFAKDEYKKIKRNENILRCKQARETSVQEKRKIPNNLECTNDSIHLKGPEKKKKLFKSKKLPKSKKPQRNELLRQWRLQKESEKKAREKSKKVPFVVKHIVYKDCGQEDTGKYYKLTANCNTKSQLNHKKNSTKVLQERNSNSISQRNPKTCEAYSKTNNINQKVKKVGTQRTKPKQSDCLTTTKNKDQTSTTKIQKQKKNQNKENENPVKDKQLVIEDNNNKFSVLNTSKEFEEEHKEHVITYITTEPVSFEPPSGLAVIDFMLKYKTEMDEILNSIPPEKSPAKSELFAGNISSIPQDSDSKPVEKPDNDTCVSTETKNTLNAKTPVMAFKEREGISNRTPSSTPKRLAMSGKRASLTPNPRNFLHKNEDPTAQGLETPKTRRSLRIVSDKKVRPQEEDQKEIEKDCSISESVLHFTKLVAAEEEKFRASLQKWEKIQGEDSAPEEFHGNILAAIGQAQLFMRKRFKQFKDLIELHKDTTAEKAAHASDLDGFWEMIYYQVADVHKRFENLDKLEANNWIAQSSAKPAKKIVKKIKPKAVNNTKTTTKTLGKVTSKRSDFKKFKQQMMAKKQAEEEKKATLPENENFVKIITPLKSKDGTKVLTPVRRSIRHLPDAPQIGSNICMIIPTDSSTSLQKHQTGLECEKQSEQNTQCKNENEEQRPLIGGNGPLEIESQDPSCLQSLRRSTRKTPSKYKSANFMQNEKKPSDISCNLFDTKKTENIDQEEEIEDLNFSKYLLKTTCEEQETRWDQLTSFDIPVPVSKDTSRSEVHSGEDLMVFTSPVAVRPSEKEKSSMTMLAEEVENLFLL